MNVVAAGPYLVQCAEGDAVFSERDTAKLEWLLGW